MAFQIVGSQNVQNLNLTTPIGLDPQSFSHLLTPKIPEWATGSGEPVEDIFVYVTDGMIEIELGYVCYDFRFHVPLILWFDDISVDAQHFTFPVCRKIKTKASSIFNVKIALKPRFQQYLHATHRFLSLRAILKYY